MNYQKQGTDFLKSTGTDFKVEYLKNDVYFDGDKETRDIYRITLRRKGEQFSFKFGQSIANSDYGNNTPTAYDVLTCLTKYDPNDFANFCSDYGYVIDSRKAEKLYEGVCREFKGVDRLFSDVIEQLQEIN